MRDGDQVKGGAKQQKQGIRPIFADFTEPASKAGAGVHIKNLYNDYVYFWRWALWRLFEQQRGGGIITFITASSYLGGPGFVGVREMMRREFEEIYIFNLDGDNLGTRKTSNVFNIQTPVAILIGYRSAAPSRTTTPAKTYYTRIEADTRDNKVKLLEGIGQLSDVQWEELDRGWRTPFYPIYPKTDHEYFSWPELTTLFPWQHSGSQFKRNWPISEVPAVLIRRWQGLIGAPPADRKKLFKETRDRKIGRSYLDADGNNLVAIENLSKEETTPYIVKYCYRQFDVQSAFLDARLADFIPPD